MRKLNNRCRVEVLRKNEKTGVGGKGQFKKLYKIDIRTWLRGCLKTDFKENQLKILMQRRNQSVMPYSEFSVWKIPFAATITKIFFLVILKTLATLRLSRDWHRKRSI